jgi:hypothetical protein
MAERDGTIFPRAKHLDLVEKQDGRAMRRSARNGSEFPISRRQNRRTWRVSTASTGPQCGLGAPNLPAITAENMAFDTASRATQCRSNPVSGRSLRKTGIIQSMARDFRHFRPATPEIGSLETVCEIAKARHQRAFLRSVEAAPRPAALRGWRRSADRTSLYANSLLTGNFTGNFAYLGL